MKTVSKSLLHGELDSDCCVVKEDWIDVSIVIGTLLQTELYMHFRHPDPPIREGRASVTNMRMSF